jgi:4-hydroxybenzoate polyprenyltransferase
MESATFKSVLKIFAPTTFLGFAAGLEMFAAQIYFKTPPDIILVLTSVALSFSIYMLNKFTDEEDSYNCPEQRLFFQRKTFLILLPVLMIIISMLTLIFSSRLALWHIILVVSGVFYSVTMVPFIKNRKLVFLRLKDVIILKNVTVGVMWGVTPFAIALTQANEIPPLTDLVIVIFAFCLTTLINSTTCDVRDMVGDRYAGVKTIPTQLGIRNTFNLLGVISLISALIISIIALSGLICIETIILFYATLIWTAIVSLPMYIKIKIPKIVTDPLTDSHLILCAVLLIIISK